MSRDLCNYCAWCAFKAMLAAMREHLPFTPINAVVRREVK